MGTNKGPLSMYWEAYGGWPALFTSKYFWCSIVLTPLCYTFWSDDSESFVAMALSALPNLLGFALGGYAVWLALGDQKLKKLLSEYDENSDISIDNPSDFMIVNATFVHFIILQIISLMYMIILKANSFAQIFVLFTNNVSMNECMMSFLKSLPTLAYGFGFFLFVYSILSMLAATFAVFKIAKWSDDLNRLPDE